MERIDELLSAYADQALDETAAEELRQWLVADPQHVDRFVRESFLHTYLGVVARRRMWHANVTAAPAADEASLDGALRSGRFHSTIAPPARLTRRRRALLALSTAAGIAVAAWSLLALRQPAVVAQITDATANTRWADASRPVAGQFLREGQALEIKRGRVTATLASGARIGVEGPARFCIEEENVVRLDAGRLSAVAPSQATGFAVRTTAGRVVDLGTEFTLSKDADHMIRLWVFVGLVEIQPLSPAGGKPFRVSESQGVRFDARTGEATRTSFDGVEMLVP